MSGDNLSPDELARRTAWFLDYCNQLDNQPADLPLRCPCCGCKTLGERGGFEICPVCFWEDDGQDDYDADVVRGGPNGALSLTLARLNYRTIGVSDGRLRTHVRLPKPDEMPNQPFP
jgi:hypothetical protein